MKAPIPGYAYIPEGPFAREPAGDESCCPPSLADAYPILRDGAGLVRVAAFDFDGTCIQGDSPVMLVRFLTLNGRLRKSVVARILLWAGAYKARLPQNEAWVRELVFSAFAGEPAGEVDRFLARFYREKVERRFRPLADACMKSHAEAGHAVVWVSATFEPIIIEAMGSHYAHCQASTRMKVGADGCYRAQVEGRPVEGPEKLAALKRLCDERFGEGGWELDWAYGDHHSDSTILSAATHAYAVTPDRPLARLAKRRNWEVLDWDLD